MRKTLLDVYLLLSPAIRWKIEWSILIGSGVIGVLFSWPKLPFTPFINILGALVFSGGLIFHFFCEKTHKQAHQQSELIECIVTDGIYSCIRHPLYLSLIIMNIGIALIFGNIWSLILVVVISILTIMTVFKEEAFLQEKFYPEYREYMKEVPWRMIPGVF